MIGIVILAISAVIFMACVCFGLIASCDPEGRGARWFFLVPVGAVGTISSLAYLAVLMYWRG